LQKEFPNMHVNFPAKLASWFFRAYRFPDA